MNGNSQNELKILSGNEEISDEDDEYEVQNGVMVNKTKKAK